MEAPPPSPPQPNQWEKRLTSSPAPTIRVQQQQVVRLSGCLCLQLNTMANRISDMNRFELNAILHYCIKYFCSVFFVVGCTATIVCLCTWFKTPLLLLWTMMTCCLCCSSFKTCWTWWLFFCCNSSYNPVLRFSVLLQFLICLFSWSYITF